MTIGTRLFTWLNGQLVGRDEQGNRYYQEKRAPKEGRRKRWVMYDGVVEASRVPAHWHSWLHYTVDTPPASNSPRFSWQKPHKPNQTGTAGAYLPPGHTLMGGQRAKTTADYEPWQP